MNKIETFINTCKETYLGCVGRVQNQELWEDYTNLHLPENLTPEEMLELIEKMQEILHYYRWANLSAIIQASKNATMLMIYVDDTSAWWRFEA